MKISVIIPTMNRLDSLRRTFSYIEKSTAVPDEIIVVDQTPDKLLCAKIEQYLKETSLNTEYIWNSEPSLTKARNSGYALAKGDIIVFMDDDVDVRPDTFSNIQELFNDEKIAMAGGINENDDLAHQSMIGVLFDKSSYRKRSIGHVTKSIYGRFPLHVGKKTPSEWAMGFFFVVRKNIMDEYNIRFDEHLKYYAYAEDLDFTYRYYINAKALGLNCIFSSMLTVKHNVSTEYRIPSKKQTYMIILHRRYLKNKLMPGFVSSAACIWSEIGDIFFRIIHKESCIDILKAQFFYCKNKRDILAGDFHYLNFM